MPHISCSPPSIAKPVPLLLLQKNWLCASQDDSLLPPTALAELINGRPQDYPGTKLHPWHSALLSLFALLQLHFSLSLSLLHSSIAADKFSKPHRKTDVDLRSLWTNWTRHYNHFVLCKSLNSKTITTWADTTATTLLLHATALQFAWTTLMLSAMKKQRLWLHLRTSLFLGGWSRD